MRERILLISLVGVLAAVPLQAPPLTIFMIGDSTMADKPLEDNPERGWGQVFRRFFDSTVTVENHARNGRSTRTFLSEKRWDSVMARLKAGDYVFIQFGHNDQSKEKTDRYTPPEQYKANLGRFVHDARSREAFPILCTPIMRRRFDSEGRFYDVHGEYPDLVRSVAKELDVPLIDMHRASEAVIVAHGEEGSKKIFLWIEPGAYASLPEGKQDNTHFSEYGALLMARLAVDGIKELKLPLSERLREECHD